MKINERQNLVRANIIIWKILTCDFCVSDKILPEKIGWIYNLQK